ncbi:thrombospondin type 3 repeat-containing protein [Patescibacteria group bacterium]|nr:thrombospondin type 3 repeat-containing protein [Patescibacteria group bacterium]
MKTKRIKLLVVVVGGVLVISVGAWLAVVKFGLGQGDNANKKVTAVISETVDTDGDGLSDKEEREKNTNVYQADTDGDGYSDGEEVADGYDPLVVQSYDNMDLDGDGLVGTDEKKYGTDPRLADSDFDGYQDGEEIVSGNNPLSANLSDYVSIKAVANASEDGRLPDDTNDNNSNENGESESGNKTADNVIEVNDKDIQQVNYLEQAFSASDAQTFQDNMVGYIETQNDVEKIAGQVQLPEVSDSDIRIMADPNDEKVRNYISNMGEIFYQSFDFQGEGGDYGLLAVNSSREDLVYQFSAAVSNSLQRVYELEVPQEDKLIDVHKKIIASLLRAEYLTERIGEGSYLNTGSQDDVIGVMNDYSELTYILKTQVIDNYLGILDQIAEERNLKTNI